MITQKDKDHSIKMNFTQLKNIFFIQLLCKSLHSEPAMEIIRAFNNTITSRSIITPFKTFKDVVDYLGVNPKNANYRGTFTAFKKLGLIIKIDGYFVMHPKLAVQLSSGENKAYFLYYFHMFKDSSSSNYKCLKDFQLEAIDTFYHSTESTSYFIDSEALSKWQKEGYHINNYQEDLYDLFYETPVNLLTKNQKNMRKAFNTTQTYKINSYLNTFAEKHIFILREQLVIDFFEKAGGVFFTFTPLKLKDLYRIPDYKKTEVYNKLPEKLKSQFLQTYNVTTGQTDSRPIKQSVRLIF